MFNDYLQRCAYVVSLVLLASSCSELIVADEGTSSSVETTSASLSRCRGGRNGQWDYCSVRCPCAMGQGDCDANNECQAGLVCNNDVGRRYRLSASVDVCEAPNANDCHGGRRPGDWDYCFPQCRCGAGQGDCDADGDCEAGLRCSSDVGRNYGFDPALDVCEIAGGGGNGGGQRDDHGNDANTATQVQLPSETGGNLENLGDQDWFRVRLRAGDRYSLDVRLDTLRDSYLHLLDRNGVNELASNDDFNGLASHLDFSCQRSGVYYLKVRAYRDQFTGTYRLAISRQGATPDARLEARTNRDGFEQDWCGNNRAPECHHTYVEVDDVAYSIVGGRSEGGELMFETLGNAFRSTCFAVDSDCEVRFRWNGTCHQHSNRVLYPSGQTVAAAGGYILSSAIYGTYGIFNWDTCRSECD